MATDGESTKTATPRLRFPEFRDKQGWETSTLADEFAQITNGKANAQDHEEGGQFPLFDRSEVVKESNEFLFDSEAVILPGEGVRFTPRYFNGAFNLHQRVYALMKCIGDARFFFYTLDQFKDLLALKAVKSTVLSLRLPIIEKFPVLVPSPSEQQKIADCLTSLDEWIAAQGRKVAALAAYKRGLMQQLFPREGESRPRLRFPEFRDAGEWNEKRLGDLGKLVSGLTYSPDDIRDKGLLVLRSSNIKNGEIALDDNVYVTNDIKGANIAKSDDILICVRNGSKALIGKNALVRNGLPRCTHGAFMTVFRAEAAHFVLQLFHTSAYRRQVAGDLGATINSINGGQLLRYRFIVPSLAEQQRIAACLGGLDARIAAESRRLASLKTHKKALMQQLFPTAGDA